MIDDKNESLVPEKSFALDSDNFNWDVMTIDH